jgi:hypothetical protein
VELVRLEQEASPFVSLRLAGSRLLLVDESAVPWVRTHWASKAVVNARRALENSRAADALRWSQLGWNITPVVTPEHVSLLVRASEAADRPALGRGIRAVSVGFAGWSSTEPSKPC